MVASGAYREVDEISSTTRAVRLAVLPRLNRYCPWAYISLPEPEHRPSRLTREHVSSMADDLMRIILIVVTVQGEPALKHGALHAGEVGRIADVPPDLQGVLVVGIATGTQPACTLTDAIV